MTGSVVTAFILATASSSTLPPAVVLDIGLVRVAPTRPGTNKPWDSPDEKPKSSPCAVLGLVATLTATPAAGGAVGTICNVLESTSGGRASTPTDPDIFVRVVARPGVSYRSYTARNALSHVFHFRVSVPVDSISREGVEFQVQNDSGQGDPETQENIGVVRLKKEQLSRAMAGGGLITLNDKQGGLERIEITVTKAEKERPKLTSFFDVKNGWGTFDGFEINAGDVVEVAASGEYQVRGKRAGPRGLEGDYEGRLAGSPFDSARVGAAVLVIGKHGQLVGRVVGGCTRFISPVAGPVLVSINDSNHRETSGEINLTLSTRTPSRAEWVRGNVEGTCVPPQNVATSDLANSWATSAAVPLRELLVSQGETLANAIQRNTHPTGSSPELGDIAVRQEGDGLAVNIQVKWKGGLLGTEYATTVLWELNARRHIRATVRDDTAAMSVSWPNKQKLDQYFASNVYPAVVGAVPRPTQ